MQKEKEPRKERDDSLTLQKSCRYCDKPTLSMIEQIAGHHRQCVRCLVCHQSEWGRKPNDGLKNILNDYQDYEPLPNIFSQTHYHCASCSVCGEGKIKTESKEPLACYPDPLSGYHYDCQPPASAPA